MKNPLLTYCTNVHPLQNYGVWATSIPFFSRKIRELLQVKSLAMGLWFNETVLEAVHSDIHHLHQNLNAWGVSTFTLNAFPQGDFHAKEVKKMVYQPDWSNPLRLQYTERCADVLAGLLPENGFGTISTLPLGWREGWTENHFQKSTAALLELVQTLKIKYESTGKIIAIALEPEPGCILERTPQVIEFWNQWLRPAATKVGLSDSLNTYLGICYDTCHQAVQFEDPAQSLTAFKNANIPIHKMQLSSALEFSANPTQEAKISRSQFVEPRFLHQTRVFTDQGIKAFDDLPEVLTLNDLDAFPWRVHYHVPIHSHSLLQSSSVKTTQSDMLCALSFALKHNLCSHFEIETYTWNVLPEALRPKTDEDLAQCLTQELNFIYSQFPGVFNHV